MGYESFTLLSPHMCLSLCKVGRTYTEIPLRWLVKQSDLHGPASGLLFDIFKTSTHALIDSLLLPHPPAPGLLRSGRGHLLLGLMEPVVPFIKMSDNSSDGTGVMLRLHYLYL